MQSLRGEFPSMDRLQVESPEHAIMQNSDSEFRIIPMSLSTISKKGQAQHCITTINELNDRIVNLSQSLEDFVLDEQVDDLVINKYIRKVSNEYASVGAKSRASLRDFSSACSRQAGKDASRKKSVDKKKVAKEHNETSQLNMSKKPMLVELHSFPGLLDEPTPLPSPLDAVAVLDIIIDSQEDLKNKPIFKTAFVEFVTCDESKSLLQDIYWWHFCKRYQNEPIVQEVLFDRISLNYTTLLFKWTGRMYQDILFKRYPDLLAQAVYVVYCHSFPTSYRQFNGDFRDQLIELISLWMVGTKPSPRTWERWNFEKLELEGMRKGEHLQGETVKAVDFEQHLADAVNKAQPGKMRRRRDTVHTNRRKNTIHHLTATNLSKLKNVNEDSSLMDIRQSGSRHGMLNVPNRTSPTNSRVSSARTVNKVGFAVAPSENESSNTQDTTSVKEKKKTQEEAPHISSVTALQDSKKQSCPAGRGPEFHRVVFDVHGRSPLVENFLQSKALSRDAGTGVRVQRTEIKSLPPLTAPTYQSVIDESRETLEKAENQYQRFYNKRLVARQKYVADVKKTSEKFQRCSRKMLSDPHAVKKMSDLLYLADPKEEPEDQELRVNRLRMLLDEALKNSELDD